MRIAPSCSARRDGSENVSFDLKSQFQNLTSGQVRSGQGEVMTQVGQYACLLKRLDEPCRLEPFARLYLQPVTSYWRKTDCDLM